MKKNITFQGYTIEKFLMEKNLTKEKDNILIECKKYKNTEHDNHYCISMIVKVFTIKSKIELTINGYFEFPKDFDENLKDDFLNISAPAIIYPYARTFISNVTAFDIDNTIILPIINFANLQSNLSNHN